MDNLYLIYVKPLGKNTNEEYEYEFFFSKTPDKAWGEDWDYSYPNFCSDLTPDEGTYSIVKRLKTTIPFFCMQQNSCFPFYFTIKNILCLCYEDISSYEEFPTPYRIVFHFGEEYKSVVEKLEGRDTTFEE